MHGYLISTYTCWCTYCYCVYVNLLLFATDTSKSTFAVRWYMYIWKYVNNTSVSPLQSPNSHRPAQQLLCACQIICAAGGFTLGTERPGCICLLWHRSSQRLLDHTWLWPAPLLHTECNHCLQPLSTCKPVTCKPVIDSTTFAARQSGADSLRASIETCVLCSALLQDRESTPGREIGHSTPLCFWQLLCRAFPPYSWATHDVR